MSAFTFGYDGLVLEVGYSIYSATMVLKKGVHGMGIVQNSRMVLPWWCGWWVFRVNECILLEIRAFCCWFQNFLGFGSRISCWYQKFVTFWMFQTSKFKFFMDSGLSSLLGVLNWNGHAKFHAFLLLQRCKICGKIYMNFYKVGQFWGASLTHWKSKQVRRQDFKVRRHTFEILK